MSDTPDNHEQEIKYWRSVSVKERMPVYEKGSSNAYACINKWGAFEYCVLIVDVFIGQREPIEFWLEPIKKPELAKQSEEIERLEMEVAGGKEKIFDLDRSISSTKGWIKRKGEENASLTSEVERLRTAIQEFVDRVERGEIRSVKTYGKFVELLRPKE